MGDLLFPGYLNDDETFNRCREWWVDLWNGIPEEERKDWHEDSYGPFRTTNAGNPMLRQFQSGSPCRVFEVVQSEGILPVSGMVEIWDEETTGSVPTETLVISLELTALTGLIARAAIRLWLQRG